MKTNKPTKLNYAYHARFLAKRKGYFLDRLSDLDRDLWVSATSAPRSAAPKYKIVTNTHINEALIFCHTLEEAYLKIYSLPDIS